MINYIHCSNFHEYAVTCALYEKSGTFRSIVKIKKVEVDGKYSLGATVYQRPKTMDLVCVTFDRPGGAYDHESNCLAQHADTKA